MSTTEYHQTTDRLPDALAFVAPTRAEFWLTLRDYDELKTCPEIEAMTDHSSATIYRMLNDLQEHGLAEQVTRIGDNGPKSAYRAVEPGGETNAD